MLVALRLLKVENFAFLSLRRIAKGRNFASISSFPASLSAYHQHLPSMLALANSLFAATQGYQVAPWRVTVSGIMGSTSYVMRKPLLSAFFTNTSASPIG